MDKNKAEKKKGFKELKKAVALKYDLQQDDAPQILASGQGEMAGRIIAAAEENNIPIKEDRDIVEVLTKLNIGDQIPPELYKAVAEILSFIYNLEDF